MVMVQNDRKKQPAGNWNMHESGLLLTVIKFTITHQIISDRSNNALVINHFYLILNSSIQDDCKIM